MDGALAVPASAVVLVVVLVTVVAFGVSGASAVEFAVVMLVAVGAAAAFVELDAAGAVVSQADSLTPVVGATGQVAPAKVVVVREDRRVGLAVAFGGEAAGAAWTYVDAAGSFP